MPAWKCPSCSNVVEQGCLTCGRCCSPMQLQQDAETWKCPQCGHAQELSQQWLAEHGLPVCPKCDIDMELQPEAKQDADQQQPEVDRLVEKCDAAGLKSEDLDDLVHELASNIASDTNNGGVEEQIRYLLKEIGAQAVEKQLDEIIEGRADPEEE
jgi:hypothetical protein